MPARLRESSRTGRHERPSPQQPSSVLSNGSCDRRRRNGQGLRAGGGDQATPFDPRTRRIRVPVRERQEFLGSFAELDAVLHDAPDDYAALFEYGRIALTSGERADQGIRALRKCATLPVKPGSLGHDAAQWHLGTLLLKRGDKAGARAAYESSLLANPGYPPALESLRDLR